MKHSILRRLLLALCFPTVLAGCSTLPRDAQNTTDKVLQSKVLVVGITNEARDEALAAREKRLVMALARRLGARVQYRVGNVHQLLDDLKEVKLPLVAAQIPSDTPFSEGVGLSQPFSKKGPDEKDYCLAVAPGENRLLLLVDQVIAEEQS